ncbi:MAG: YifB family Mg chelatase-like AAA ATPase [Gammaproteobacteria bacterium]|nr:YifB family Mg chelatase-like AAA ATPase [Gammaproteobacteria bacterium]
MKSNFITISSRSLSGMQAIPVSVEVCIQYASPGIRIVGLPDAEVKEARERVRAAITNSGWKFPNDKRIIVNLAPADLPKDSGRFDLPIALAILAATDQIPEPQWHDYEFAGELSLNGDVRAIRGALAMCIASYRQNPHKIWILPHESALEAALLPDATIYSANHLNDVVQHFLKPETHPLTKALAPKFNTKLNHSLCLNDVKGQDDAKLALEIASSGGHNLLLQGPPGTGKSMLAHRLASILPPPTLEQSLEIVAIYSIAGKSLEAIWQQRPTRHPHHSASVAALIGGGTPPHPGEISLSHHGVLFLDEILEFPRIALEALREPIETGYIALSRANFQTEFPAKFQLIATMNPCPCGYAGCIQPECKCSSEQIARYRAKLSGPLKDRMDLLVHTPMLPSEILLSPESNTSEKSETVRARCTEVRQRCIQRQGKSNAELTERELANNLDITGEAMQIVHKATKKWAWTNRSIHRTLRVARTIADIAHSHSITEAHIQQAIHFRVSEI